MVDVYTVQRRCRITNEVSSYSTICIHRLEDSMRIVALSVCVVCVVCSAES